MDDTETIKWFWAHAPLWVVGSPRPGVFSLIELPPWARSEMRP